MSLEDLGAERRARLAAARLYLVCGASVDRSSSDQSSADRRDLPDLLRAAVAGGVEIVQLREKHLADDQLVAVADAARALCERLGALLIVNDRPFVALQAGPTGCTSDRTTCPLRRSARWSARTC